MAYSQPITDMLCELFAVSGINAAFEEKPGCGIFTIRMKLRCRLQTAQMLVLVREDNFSTLTTIPLAADERQPPGRRRISDAREFQHAQRQL